MAGAYGVPALPSKARSGGNVPSPWPQLLLTPRTLHPFAAYVNENFRPALLTYCAGRDQGVGLVYTYPLDLWVYGIGMWLTFTSQLWTDTVNSRTQFAHTNINIHITIINRYCFHSILSIHTYTRVLYIAMTTSPPLSNFFKILTVLCLFSTIAHRIITMIRKRSDISPSHAIPSFAYTLYQYLCKAPVKSCVFPVLKVV